MNPEQKLVLEFVKKGVNILITGSAGVGKSFVLKEIVNICRSNHITIAITSSTGTSALTINGKTIHSFLGIGLAKKDPFHVFTANKKKRPLLLKQLESLKILIIDEVSMISAKLLDFISSYLGHVRKNALPFGGIQIILCGDMYQLPPVQGRDDDESAEFCFFSKVWKQANFKCIELISQMRQQNDQKFAKLLNEAREGFLSDENFEILNQCKNPNFGEIQPTLLFALNKNVDEINNKEYSKLINNGNQRQFFQTEFSSHPDTKAWAESVKIPEMVDLCIGAQVMLTVNMNLDEGLANGSRGVITGFEGDNPIVLFKNGDQIIIEPWVFIDENEKDNLVWAKAMPLRLAYALTIHKSQSMTLDAAIIDLGPTIFEYGQAYVALSRVRDLESVQILKVSKRSFKTNPKVIQFYNEIRLEAHSYEV